jgi:N-acyl-L-homoserine lactone synthetase
MIRLVQGIDREKFPRDIDAMHRNRAEVFADRMGWEVDVVDGWEQDRFDDCNPLYLISIDSMTGAYCGSTRLLPTTGPNMLRDVFWSLLDEGETVASATIWEASRFSVDPAMEAARSANSLNRTTGELICGAFEVGLMAGLTHLVAVFDARMLRVFERANCHPDIIGTPRRIGCVTAYAGVFDVSEATLASVRAAAGITDTVLESTTAEAPCFVA